MSKSRISAAVPASTALRFVEKQPKRTNRRLDHEAMILRPSPHCYFPQRPSRSANELLLSVALRQAQCVRGRQSRGARRLRVRQPCVPGAHVHYSQHRRAAAAFDVLQNAPSQHTASWTELGPFTPSNPHL